MFDKYHSDIQDNILSLISLFERKFFKSEINNNDEYDFTRQEWESIYGSSLKMYLYFLPQIRHLGLVDHIYLAAKYNNIEIADYIYQKHGKWYTADEKSYSIAGENGNLNFIKWLHNKKCPYRCGNQAIAQSILAGHDKCLDYLLSLDSTPLETYHLVSSYLGNSNLACAKLLKEKYNYPIKEASVKLAIENKNFELFQYLFTHLSNNYNIKDYVLIASEYGCSKIFIYLLNQSGCSILSGRQINNILKKARKYQYFGIISYLENQIH